MSEPINPKYLKDFMLRHYRHANGLSPHKLNPLDPLVENTLDSAVDTIQALAAEAIEKAVLEELGKLRINARRTPRDIMVIDYHIVTERIAELKTKYEQLTKEPQE